MTGCLNKRRFSLKFPDGIIDRFGCCDPKVDDRRNIVSGHLIHQDLRGEEYPDIRQTKLPDGTLWTNGYYDKEHDGWKPLADWK